ncbi:leucine-rich repeat domain-containing protein [Ferrimonas balearica]|uniref:leucine-rich repeat domain-containing protein n=1 Tax=Ferrimonas balearica TaxID=44012 RepID=UPI001F464B08|nr:hypothetical protein [Ferrimonas balearica]MBY6095761.1 hypothetical protein [Ferrimonas balearica]
MRTLKIYDDLESYLKKIHPDVTELIYDCDDPIPSWQALATAFPNATQIRFSDMGHIGITRLINHDFFDAFPRLHGLFIGNNRRSPITTDLSGVNPAHLTELRQLELGRCRTGDFDLFGNLPKLESLTVLADDKQVRLHTGPDCVLTKVCMAFGPRVRAIDIDLASSPVVELALGHNNRHYPTEAKKVVIDRLVLPNHLHTLLLNLNTQTPLPARLLGDNQKLDKLEMRLAVPGFSADTLSDLSEVGKIHFLMEGKTAPLSAGFFAGLRQVDELEIRFEDTPIEGPLLPANMSLRQLTYFNASGHLSDTDALVLPDLDVACMFGLKADQLGWLAHSPMLQRLNLYLDKRPLTDLPPLPNLKHLVLRGTEMAQLPATVRSNPNLETLALLWFRIGELGDLSAMTGLKELWLSPLQDKQSNLPPLDGLTHLPQLEELRLDIELKRFDPDWLKLAPGARLMVRAERFEALFDILRASHLDNATVHQYLDQLIAVQKPAQLPAMPADFHLVMMEAKHNRFKAQHKAWLRSVAQQSEQQRPFGADSVLFVCGRSAFKASELKAQAETIGFTLSKALNDSVTHVLVGTAPKAVAQLDPERHALIDDTTLQQCFTAEAPKFLQQETSNVMADSVMAMLNSPDEASHKVAAQMLEQGGVTEPMLMPLFLILKTTADNELRKQIKNLLAGHGDDAFQLAVNDRILFHTCRGPDRYGREQSQGSMVKKLKGQRRKWGDALCNDFAKAYYDRFGEGLMYLMMQRDTCPHREAILDTLVEGECLNWHRGAGFGPVLERADEKLRTDLHWHPQYCFNRNADLGSAVTYIPEGMAQRHDIRELNLSVCLLDNLPKGSAQFTGLRRLNLSFNAFEKLPASLANFAELEELDLSYNHFSAFPAVLLKLKNLKRLDLRRATRVDYTEGYNRHYRKLAVPQAFRDALPHCEILEDA